MCVWAENLCMTKIKAAWTYKANMRRMLTLAWHADSVNGNLSGESSRMVSWVPMAVWWKTRPRHTHTHAYTCIHTYTHTFSENMFGHSFVPFKNADTTSTAQFKCVFACVVVVVCILAVAAVRRVKKFRKGGFPLVPLNQQQLFGTFNIY